MSRHVVCTFTSAGLLLLFATVVAGAEGQDDQLVPRRSSQIYDGFGINSDLPRDPYIPWNRWWWTRMFDAGINFIRIGQYENSSDYTSWDWVERRRGEYSVDPNLDDYVDSLRENGVHIEIQLLYGNPLYTTPVARVPDVISPEPGSFHNPDRSLYSVFWPPKTMEQLDAFARYVTWMVKHFSGRVEYYEVWNEPNIEYWNPIANPEDYGKLFKAAAAAIHSADPNAKAVFGGLAGGDLQFAKRALDACACAASIDVFAYHNYPGYGHNLNPEAASENFDTNSSSRPLREMVRHYPGVKQDLVFWDDEFNDGIPSWTGSDESVQAKYVPRGLLIDRAEGVRTFVWLIIGATDGNEFDDFGILHGMRYRPDDFAPRPVFSAIQNTYTLFSDTRPDPTIKLDSEIAPSNLPAPRTYAFRSANGKSIVAWWLPVLSKPAEHPKETFTLKIEGSGIANPVMVDISTGRKKKIAWASGSHDRLENLPLTDSVMAVADQTFFDWPELPEAPSDLNAEAGTGNVQLSWHVHSGHPDTILIERRVGYKGQWQQIAKLPHQSTSYTDERPGTEPAFYRLRAENRAGDSAFSNIASSPRTQ
jgi:hypothetical protein